MAEAAERRPSNARRARVVLETAADMVVLAWLFTGDAGWAIPFGVLWGIVMGLWRYAEEGSGASPLSTPLALLKTAASYCVVGAVLAVAAERGAELEPMSLERFAVGTAGLVPMLCLLWWWGRAPEGRELAPGLRTGLVYAVTIAAVWALLWLGLSGPWFASLLLAAFATELAFRATRAALRRSTRR